MASHKNVALNFSANKKVSKNMNPDLAYMLFSNLIKNAISHGNSGSNISMELDEKKFSISNFSEAKSLEEEPVFERFQKFNGNTNSTGLGLSISKAIAERYDFALNYSYKKAQHTFVLSFP